MYNSPEKRKGIGRDIFMLALGAIISFITSFSTQLLNNQHEHRKDHAMAKRLFVDQLADDCGHRLFLLNELYTDKKRGVDSAAAHSLSKYNLSLDRWYQKDLSVYPRLESYFSKTRVEQFDTYIYIPLSNLGNIVASKTYDAKADTGAKAKFQEVRMNLRTYFSMLYKDLNQDEK